MSELLQPRLVDNLQVPHQNFSMDFNLPGLFDLEFHPTEQAGDHTRLLFQNHLTDQVLNLKVTGTDYQKALLDKIEGLIGSYENPQVNAQHISKSGGTSLTSTYTGKEDTFSVKVEKDIDGYNDGDNYTRRKETIEFKFDNNGDEDPRTIKLDDVVITKNFGLWDNMNIGEGTHFHSPKDLYKLITDVDYQNGKVHIFPSVDKLSNGKDNMTYPVTLTDSQDNSIEIAKENFPLTMSASKRFTPELIYDPQLYSNKDLWRRNFNIPYDTVPPIGPFGRNGIFIR